MRAVITASEIAAALGEFEPTSEQAAVIEAPLAPALVVAGAGSGKTATMAARVVYLVVNRLVLPDDVLGLTFTRKAAGELSDRVRRSLEAARTVLRVDGGELGPTISTYNAYAAGLVRDHALRVGAEPDATLITRAGAWQLMDELVRGWPRDLAVSCTPGTAVNRALAMAEAMRSHLVTPAAAREGLLEILAELEEPREGRTYRDEREVRRVQAERLALLDVVAAFEDRKRELGVVEFSDQVAIACEVARQVPAVGEAVRSRHPLVLLDEFQDTSVAQLDLLADLYGPGHPVTAVGDPNQAIYGWRGASAASLVGFQQRFSAPGAPVATLSLSTAWRNDLAILAAANEVSGPLRQADSPGAGLIRPLQPRAAAAAGQVDVSIELTGTDEARAIARWIGERWAPGTDSSAAVLCRARKQFPALLGALRERGLPATVVGLSGLLTTPEVIDLRSALEVAHDAARGDSLMRLLTNDRLGLADLSVLAEWARTISEDPGVGEADTASIVEAVDYLPPPQWETRDGHALSAAGRARVARLRRTLRDIRSFLSHPLPELVAAAERALGLDIEVAARPGVDPTAARANLDAFHGHAATFAAGSPHPTLGGFLAWLTAAEENERGLDMAQVDVTTDAVQILTVHAAKGLEWDVVAVAGLSEGQFPAGVSARGQDAGWLTQGDEFPYPLRGDEASLPVLDTSGTSHKELQEAFGEFAAANFAHQMAEERRLAYVAFTRPRHHLLLSACWFREGPKDHARPSRFLSELLPLARVPRGFRLLPEPPADTFNPDLAREVRASYPGADPAGERREVLAAAALAVRGAAAENGGIPAGGGLAAELAALDAALQDAGPRGRELADTARALLAERARRSAPPQLIVPGHLSASAAMALVRDPEGFALQLRRPLPFRPRAGARTGTDFHAWVENHLTTPALIFDDDLDWDWDGAVPAADLGTLIGRFRASRWEGRTPLAVELDLETAVGGCVVRCRVDAVFPDGEGVEVVDWKTGRCPRGAAEFDDRQLQLALYRLAYARATGLPLEAVRATFFYVAEATELRADAWTEAQIEQRLAAALAAVGNGGA